MSVSERQSFKTSIPEVPEISCTENGYDAGTLAAMLHVTEPPESVALMV